MSTDSPAGGRSPLLVVFLTVFIDLLGFGIVIPLLPVYSKMYGATEQELGLLFAAFSGMQLLFAPMWGRVSDRIGRRPVLLGGLLGTAGAYVLFAHAPSLSWLMVSRLLAGFFGANISTAQAYIADVTTPENRAKGMGMLGAAFGLGFTFGPPLGGELTRVSPLMPGYVAAGLSLAAAAFGFFKLVEPPVGRRSGSRVFSLSHLRAALSQSRIGVLFLLYFLAIFAFAAFEAMFTPFGLVRFPEHFGLKQAVEVATREEVIKAAPYAGRYLFFIGVISAVIQGGFIRRLVPRFGEPLLAVVGPFLLGLSLLILGVATHVPAGVDGQWLVVIAGCLVMPFGFGLNNPALTGMISRASPETEQGAYLGMSQSVGSLARMSGPYLAGTLFTVLGPSSPFLVAALLLFAAAAIASWYRGRHGGSFPRRGA
jgi:DHA1 family tetracycline resistance protein-like MFS transporter